MFVLVDVVVIVVMRVIIVLGFVIMMVVVVVVSFVASLVSSTVDALGMKSKHRLNHKLRRKDEQVFFEDCSSSIGSVFAVPCVPGYSKSVWSLFREALALACLCIGSCSSLTPRNLQIPRHWLL